MNRNVVLGLIFLAITLGTWVSYQLNHSPSETTSENTTYESSQTEATKPTEGSPEADFTEIKAAHYVSTTPKNNEVLTTIPSEIKLNFNSTIGSNSIITLVKNGSPLTTPTPTISANKLSLTIPFNDNAGSYKVGYTVCWLDKSCHDGSFGFIVAGP